MCCDCKKVKRAYKTHTSKAPLGIFKLSNQGLKYEVKERCSAQEHISFDLSKHDMISFKSLKNGN